MVISITRNNYNTKVYLLKMICKYILENAIEITNNPNLFRDYNRAVVLEHPRTLTIFNDDVDADINKIQ